MTPAEKIGIPARPFYHGACFSRKQSSASIRRAVPAAARTWSPKSRTSCLSPPSHRRLAAGKCAFDLRSRHSWRSLDSTPRAHGVHHVNRSRFGIRTFASVGVSCVGGVRQHGEARGSYLRTDQRDLWLRSGEVHKVVPLFQAEQPTRALQPRLRTANGVAAGRASNSRWRIAPLAPVSSWC